MYCCSRAVTTASSWVRDIRVRDRVRVRLGMNTGVTTRLGSRTGVRLIDTYRYWYGSGCRFGYGYKYGFI